MRKLKLAAAGLAGTIARRLPFSWKTELFRIFANTIGVNRATFAGHHGPFTAPVNDRVIWPSYVAYGALNNGTSEFLNSVFKTSGGTMIDVGANVGMLCMPAAKAQPTLHVYAVEADPENFQCLQINALQSGVHNAILINRAAFSRNCRLEFEHSDDNPGDHRVRSGKKQDGKDFYHESSRAVISVEAATLDSLVPLDGLKHPIVLKADVQGAEAEVFLGAAQLLEVVDIVILEFWPYGLKRAGSDIDTFLKSISRFKFGAQLEVLNADTIKVKPIAEVVAELREFYNQEANFLHLDVLLSKAPL